MIHDAAQRKGMPAVKGPGVGNLVTRSAICPPSRAAPVKAPGRRTATCFTAPGIVVAIGGRKR